MNPPVWLSQLHRQWQARRGKRVEQSCREFSQPWLGLLESAGITSTEDQANATREVEALAKAGHLGLKRHRYRTYLIERVTLPLTQEAWLRGLFGASASHDLLAASLDIIAGFSQTGHPRFPNEWTNLCATLRLTFSQGRSLRPFTWTHPATLKKLLDTIHALSSRDWPPSTLIRQASVAIGLDSKGLERHQRTFESGLARLFGTATPLKSLGFVGGESHVELHGPVCLHFADGTKHHFDGLSQVLISAADLARCSAVSTRAGHLLTIENRKTTFRQFAAANGDHSTLLAATSFPTQAFRDLLAKLPASLPHYHFGDTDPAGWHILLKLREATPRLVLPFQMAWRPAATPSPLTPYDRQLLPKLLAAPLLADVHREIQTIADRLDRGDFEQETLGLPCFVRPQQTTPLLTVVQASWIP